MVIIRAFNDINMQRHPRVLGPALKAMVDHFGAQFANLFPIEVEAADEERAGGDVEDCARECFV